MQLEAEIEVALMQTEKCQCLLATSSSREKQGELLSAVHRGSTTPWLTSQVPRLLASCTMRT